MKVRIVSDEGETLISEELGAKAFKSGSSGYHATFKVGENGARYQANVQLVLIGSKPKAGK